MIQQSVTCILNIDVPARSEFHTDKGEDASPAVRGESVRLFHVSCLFRRTGRAWSHVGQAAASSYAQRACLRIQYSSCRIRQLMHSDVLASFVYHCKLLCPVINS